MITVSNLSLGYIALPVRKIFHNSAYLYHPQVWISTMIKLALPWIQIWSISTLQKIPEITQIHLFWKGQVQLIIKPEVTTILLRVQTPAKATITRFYVELVQRTLPAHLMRYQRLASPVLCLGFNVKILNIIFRTVRVNARGKKTEKQCFPWKETWDQRCYYRYFYYHYFEKQFAKTLFLLEENSKNIKWLYSELLFYNIPSAKLFL